MKCCKERHEPRAGLCASLAAPPSSCGAAPACRALPGSLRPSGASLLSVKSAKLVSYSLNCEASKEIHLAGAAASVIPLCPEPCVARKRLRRRRLLLRQQQQRWRRLRQWRQQQPKLSVLMLQNHPAPWEWAAYHCRQQPRMR